MRLSVPRSLHLQSKMAHPCELRQNASVRQVEDLIAEDGAYEPSSGQHAQRAQSHQHHGVETAELLREDGIVAVVDHKREPIVRHSNRRDTRRGLSNPPARSAQSEEVVPCEGRRARGRLGRWCSGTGGCISYGEFARSGASGCEEGCLRLLLELGWSCACGEGSGGG